MKSMKRHKGRILSDHDLKGALGGTDASAPPVDNGGGQSSDARVQIIEIGVA